MLVTDEKSDNLLKHVINKTIITYNMVDIKKEMMLP